MNKLTKSELIIKLCGRSKVKLKPDSHIDAYNEGVRACLDFIGDTEIIPDPVPEVDTELEEAKKLVGTWVIMKDDPDFDESFSFKVIEVYRDKTDNEIKVYHGRLGNFLLKEVEPVWVTPKRCCVDDPPKNEQKVLVLSCGVYEVYQYRDGRFFGMIDDYGQSLKKSDLWYPLPPRGE